MVKDPHGPPPLRVEVERSGPATVITPHGELDVASAHRVVTAAIGLVRGTGPVTLDLGHLTFVDVAGIRAVLHAASLLGDRLEVRPASPAVHRVFVLTGAERTLPFATPGNVSAFPDVAQRNLRFARRVWQAFSEAGVEGVLRVVPPAMEWRLLAGGGSAVHGTDEFRALYADSNPIAEATDFRSVGDNVLVDLMLREPGGADRPLYSLLEFDRGTLVRATTFEHEREALAVATSG